MNIMKGNKYMLQQKSGSLHHSAGAILSDDKEMTSSSRHPHDRNERTQGEEVKLHTCPPALAQNHKE